MMRPVLIFTSIPAMRPFGLASRYILPANYKRACAIHPSSAEFAPRFAGEIKVIHF